MSRDEDQPLALLTHCLVERRILLRLGAALDVRRQLGYLVLHQMRTDLGYGQRRVAALGRRAGRLLRAGAALLEHIHAQLARKGLRLKRGNQFGPNLSSLRRLSRSSSRDLRRLSGLALVHAKLFLQQHRSRWHCRRCLHRHWPSSRAEIQRAGALVPQPPAVGGAHRGRADGLVTRRGSAASGANANANPRGRVRVAGIQRGLRSQRGRVHVVGARQRGVRLVGALLDEAVRMRRVVRLRAGILLQALAGLLEQPPAGLVRRIEEVTGGPRGHQGRG